MRSPEYLGVPAALALALFGAGCSDMALQTGADERGGDDDDDGVLGDDDEEPPLDDDAADDDSGPAEDDDGATDGDDGGGDDDSGGDDDTVTPDPGQLTAAEWRDLDHWEFWRDVTQREEIAAIVEHWGFDTDFRVSVDVVDAGAPVVDALVQAVDEAGDVAWGTRTDVHGRAELFPGLFTGETGTYTIEVESGEATASVSGIESAAWAEPVVVDLAGAPAPYALDLMFMVDTTGSMSDELSYLQIELLDVLERVRDAAGEDLDTRVSVNFYRDEGDAYVVRSFPFTTDFEEAMGQLEDQGANGGGDWPEAVDQALDDAVLGHEWSQAATARLVFLVLDAPPHDDAEILQSVRASIGAAAASGIRVVPVASSGVDRELELLLRLMGIATGGTYTFLTDDSGIGGDHLEPIIGEYEVEYLNDLLVRLVTASVGLVE